ncbi:hypothetical protein D3C72_652860 [compost metagenome]
MRSTNNATPVEPFDKLRTGSLKCPARPAVLFRYIYNDSYLNAMPIKYKHPKRVTFYILFCVRFYFKNVILIQTIKPPRLLDGFIKFLQNTFTNYLFFIRELNQIHNRN